MCAYLKSDAVVSAPDLSDPRAEYVICTDACDVAAGGVLLQWQHPSGRGPGPPDGVPLRGDKGSDPLTQSWRLACGWKLRTVAFYSRTFDVAQRNYATFDKESAAILFCCRKWAKLITCHPTTVYTDSVVAASMLTKHMGPPRLQRWGMELGTFLPYLKIGYRRGVDNGMADFLSRYPTFENYVSKPMESAPLPDELFDVIGDVPLFTHELGPDEDYLRKARLTLIESKDPRLVTEVWQAQSLPKEAATPEILVLAAEYPLPRITGVIDANTDASPLVSRLAALEHEIRAGPFHRGQLAFEECVLRWSQYMDVFETTMGRAPVLYDLRCGEGVFSRDAREAGCKCYGFDPDPACREQ